MKLRICRRNWLISSFFTGFTFSGFTFPFRRAEILSWKKSLRKCTFSAKKAYRQGVCFIPCGCWDGRARHSCDTPGDTGSEKANSALRSQLWHLQDSTLWVCLNSAVSSTRPVMFLLSVVLVSIQLSSLKGRSSFYLIFILIKTSLNSSLRGMWQNIEQLLFKHHLCSAFLDYKAHGK